MFENRENNNKQQREREADGILEDAKVEEGRQLE